MNMVLFEAIFLSSSTISVIYAAPVVILALVATSRLSPDIPTVLQRWAIAPAVH